MTNLLIENIKTLSENIDTLTLTVTILLAIIGWIFALLIQQWGTKQQHKIQVRYEIYKQFVQIHKEAQDAISKLNAHSSPPFILMESSMIPFKLGLKKQYKDMWLPYNEQECVFEGEQKWTAYTQELYSHYSKFSEKFLQFMYITEDWEAALEPILPAKNVLNKEIENQKRLIHSLISELSSYTSKHNHDWRKWDQKGVEKITQKISESAMSVGSYIGDFMVLTHNELLSSYFGHERRTRKTLDPSYKVLTKEGIVENVDHKLVKNMQEWKDQMIVLVKEKLTKESGDQTTEAKELNSLVDDACPFCGTALMVMETKNTSEGIFFAFACGHNKTLKDEKISC
ncbi:MAG: hypothetical protein AAB365_00330 [Patescibacteria group bacterium]